MKNIIKTYAWYNSVPLCKMWDGDTCINIESATIEQIQKHNNSPLSCVGDGCAICEKICQDALKENKVK